MRSLAKNVGKFGEDLAKDFLVSRGYKILERNLCLGKKEIDLVARLDRVTIFVEVKTVSSPRQEDPELALTPKQTRTLKKAISAYCFQRKVNKNSVRLDLITVTLSPFSKTARIKHYRDIL